MEPVIPTTIAHVIPLAVAPVFLLTGIAGMLGVMTNRLSRVVDHSLVVIAVAVCGQLVFPAEDVLLRQALVVAAVFEHLDRAADVDHFPLLVAGASTAAGGRFDVVAALYAQAAAAIDFHFQQYVGGIRIAGIADAIAVGIQLTGIGDAGAVVVQRRNAVAIGIVTVRGWIADDERRVSAQDKKAPPFGAGLVW